MLNEEANNYLASIYVRGARCGIAFCDVSHRRSAGHRGGRRPSGAAYQRAEQIPASEILFNDELLDLRRSPLYQGEAQGLYQHRGPGCL